MSLREEYEAFEEKFLSEKATLSRNSRGRRKPEPKCPIRTDFQRDRDRIVHSKAFRRLMHKTQVFLSPEGDHYRTRLTHTIEVSQISRTIARALRLNEDLTEAIALGHDLGHTPFGHMGEEALTECLGEIRVKQPHRFGVISPSFHHHLQSLRVVEVVERGGKGLNLTWEVKDGIKNHTGETLPSTWEGQVVRIADRIAYINHDIDDALRAGIIKFEELPQEPLEHLGSSKGKRIDSMVKDMIESTEREGKVCLSSQGEKAMDDLRKFLFSRVYVQSIAKAEDEKAKGILKSLFFYYLDKPEKLPQEFQPLSDEELPLKVCDYVAGMTDRYALRMYEKIFLPKPWMI
jgi:dGTPase